MSLAAVIFVSLVTTTVGQSSSTAADAAQQASESKSTSEALPVSLDRIRKALDETPAAAQDAPKLKIDTAGVPVFRTQTQGSTIKLTHVLDDGTNVGPYVRPPNGPYDYEFKQMVTPDALKGCGRWSTRECVQSYANQFASALLWNYATQRKSAAVPAVPAPPDPETLRIRAQIQQELLDQQAAGAATPPSKP